LKPFIIIFLHMLEFVVDVREKSVFGLMTR
jgi:hypothetical protein